MKGATVLAIDLGSSSFKACLFRNRRRTTSVFSVPVKTRVSGSEAEILPEEIDACIRRLIRCFGKSVKEVDVISLCNQSPSLTVISGRGKLLFPVITHLDRRSSEDSELLLNTVGASRWLATTGNLPFPGGIAISSMVWIQKHHATVFRDAVQLGSLNTYLQNAWTGKTAMDPANASFMGLFDTVSLGGWNSELCALLKLEKGRLPEIKEAYEVAGNVCTETGQALGFRSGVPVLTGTIDTSSSVLAATLGEGDILHLSGTTDVLAALTNKPIPSDQYLTRGLGWGMQWLSVRTVAAGGATLKWCDDIFGKEMSRRFQKSFAKKPFSSPVVFEPYLAGDRLSIWPKSAAFKKLSLGTTREEMMGAILSALRDESIGGLRALSKVFSLTGKVCYSGNNKSFADWVHTFWKREWKKDWDFQYDADLALKGLNELALIHLK